MDESLIRRARYGSKAAMQTLIETLSHEDYYTAEWASESFFKVGQRTVRPLVAVLQDRDATVQARILAAEALNQLGSREGTTAQLAALQDPTEPIELRRTLAAYAGYIGDERSLGPLVRIALDASADRAMRGGAILGLGSLLDLRAVPALLTLARGDDARLGHAARLALDRLGGAERYLAEGPPEPPPWPRHFRTPVPGLDAPSGASHVPEDFGCSHFSLDSTATLRTDRDLAAVSDHYERQLAAAWWRKRDGHVGEDEAWSSWTFRRKWWLDARARLLVTRMPGSEDVFRIEMQARWQPARWFSLNWVDDPFASD